MRRALGEYAVAGIKTTVPFFVWLLEQREFLDGAFHTTYLDEILRSRNGKPFREPSADAEEEAAIAAALQAVLAPGTVPHAGAVRLQPAQGGGSRWKSAARAEASRPR